MHTSNNIRVPTVTHSYMCERGSTCKNLFLYGRVHVYVCMCVHVRTLISPSQNPYVTDIIIQLRNKSNYIGIQSHYLKEICLILNPIVFPQYKIGKRFQLSCQC